MALEADNQKVVIVGAGPVGSLAALYAANRGDDVHVYELRAGMCGFLVNFVLHLVSNHKASMKARIEIWNRL